MKLPGLLKIYLINFSMLMLVLCYAVLCCVVLCYEEKVLGSCMTK